RPLPAGTAAADALARYRAVLRSNDVNAAIHGVFRRSVLDRVGPHRLHGSDRLIVAHAALLGPFAYVPEALFGYRIHAASTVHLTRAEWLAREAGRLGAGSALDGARTLAVYLRATGQADLKPTARARALVASAGYAVRPDVLRRLFLPGVDNYLGWTHWPGQAARRPARVPQRSCEVGPWTWMVDGDRVNTRSGVSMEGTASASDRTTFRAPARP
ncbi:MAG TPA: hypothetical protein VF594_03615, partial [Rubricoccaceae bacterium]